MSKNIKKRSDGIPAQQQDKKKMKRTPAIVITTTSKQRNKETKNMKKPKDQRMSSAPPATQSQAAQVGARNERSQEDPLCMTEQRKKPETDGRNPNTCGHKTLKGRKKKKKKREEEEEGLKRECAKKNNIRTQANGCIVQRC